MFDSPPGNLATLQLPAAIDSTMLSAFRSCPRKFFWQFCYGLQGRQPKIDLVAGAAFAAALERTYREFWLNKRLLPEALLRAHVSFTKEWGDFPWEPPSATSTKSFSRMWETVLFYFDRYPPQTDHIRPYLGAGKPTLEFSFAIPLDAPSWPRHPQTGEPFLYCGRFDMLGEYEGRICIRDEKTTGRSAKSLQWAESWDLRSQFIGYTWACHQMGFPTDLVFVRGLFIQKTQLDSMEAMKTYPSYLRERWLSQVKKDLEHICYMWHHQDFDYNFADSCTSYGNCQFIPLCTSPDPSSWFDIYHYRRWSPLSLNHSET